MMTSRRWYEAGKDAEWRKLLNEQPIIREAFEIILRTTMEQRETDPSLEVQALQNAKRDGIYGTLLLLELGLANPPAKPKKDKLPAAKAWTTRRKEEIENESTSDGGNAPK
jgi:hypothetical protein